MTTVKMTMLIKFVLKNIPIREVSTKWPPNVHTVTEVCSSRCVTVNFVCSHSGDTGVNTGNQCARAQSVWVLKQNTTADIIKVSELD